MTAVYVAAITLLLLVGSNFSAVPLENFNSQLNLGFSGKARETRDVVKDSLETDEYTKAMMERWLKILHLSQLPDNTPKNVPKYMEVLFNISEINSPTSIKLDPTITGEQAAWAIKSFQAKKETDNLMINFNVLLDFNPSMISRVELVIEGDSSPFKFKRRFKLSYGSVEICSNEGKDCQRQDVQYHQFNGVRHQYDIYDITLLFVSWWSNHTVSCTSCSMYIHVIYPLSFIESFTDLNSSDLLLVIYQNTAPDLRLKRKVLNHLGSSSLAHQSSSAEERQRRAAKQESGLCQLHEWWIDFHDLGLTWIVVPNRFRANFCKGSCPAVSTDMERVNLTNHAFMRTIHHTVLEQHGNVNISVPAPTCVPIRYSPMSILYRANNETFILRSINDMIATSCGCL